MIDLTALPSEDDFDRLMDAEQTLIQLTPGDVLTAEMIADLQLVDKHHRDEFERSVEAFDRGYQAGIDRGAGADTAKLIRERDEARSQATVANACSSMWQRTAFIQAAQVCREMIARFVEQGGDAAIAASIRANWRPAWGDDPGAPSAELYERAAPVEISCKPQAQQAA